jgi:hypothetical protein
LLLCVLLSVQELTFPKVSFFVENKILLRIRPLYSICLLNDEMMDNKLLSDNHFNKTNRGSNKPRYPGTNFNGYSTNSIGYYSYFNFSCVHACMCMRTESPLLSISTPFLSCVFYSVDQK